MSRVKLAYETTLPSHLYPCLRRLFAVQKFCVNQLIRQFWSKKWLEALGGAGNVWKPVREWF